MENSRKPSNPLVYTIINQGQVFEYGITLRDYFANSAMQSIITRLGGRPFCDANEQDIFNLLAKEAYKYADAMLKHRENGK